jgi:RimJ/RimL family protein N-acetyltransferase
MWVFMPGDFSRFFELQTGQAEINYCVTPERFRGRGMFRKALVAAVGLLGRRGVREVLIATHGENGPAMRAIESAGFRKLGVVRHFGMFYRPKWRVPT